MDLNLIIRENNPACLKCTLALFTYVRLRINHAIIRFEAVFHATTLVFEVLLYFRQYF